MNMGSDVSSRRRGVLLLVVLSMLTLFLLLGTAYLVVSSRSRLTARAFNRLVMQSEEARIPVDRCLDQVLLHVVRGGTAAGIPKLAGTGARPAAHFESLLEDKYGRSTTLTGTAQTITASSGTALGPVLTLTNVSLAFGGTGSPLPVPQAAELPGRVLTLCPENGAPTSHRILKATGSSQFTLQVESPASNRPFRLSGSNCRVVVNGREFDGQGTTNEPWDGFDDANRFLAQIVPSGTVVSSGSTSLVSFIDVVDIIGTGTQVTLKSGTTLVTGTISQQDKVDSDNDGQADSLFLNFDLPSIASASGTVQLDAAVLVVDLDSRFNVNAHGSLASRIYPAGAGWPTVTGTTLADVPLGSGYGPPEVNGEWMYPQDAASTGYPPNRQVTDQRSGEAEDNAFAVMVGSGTGVTGQRPTGSRFTVSGSTPAFEPLQGRYGEAIRGSWANYRLATATAGDPLPGQAVTDDLLSQITDQQSPPAPGQGTAWTVPTTNTTGVPTSWWDGTNGYDWEANRSRTSYNSPPDLHGRMKTVSLDPTGQGIVPRLAYAKVEWGNRETTDDPYELMLGPTAPQNGWMGDPNVNGSRPVYDNPFSIAELEAVLRPYDTDTFRLPMRLAATLGSVAEESRLRVTTSSWDTTAITGTASANLAQWIRTLTTSTVSGTSATSGVLGGEVARWEKFNLNRPLTSVTSGTYSPTEPYYVQRQAYFKDLYTLICAVLHPSGTPPADKAKEYAQWAANVVEFRDADSTMTPFEYDINPKDGWTVYGDASLVSSGTDDRDVVWGAERPEILIMETSAWEDDTTGELFITLHRPWNAVALSTSGSVAAEPCDAALDVSGAPQNLVDLGRTSGTSSYPIWRLRIVDDEGASQLVRLDNVGASPPPSDFTASSINSAAKTPKMAPDSWLCIHGQNSLGAQITASGTVLIDQGGPFRVPGAPGAGPARSATVYLERLTNPASTVTGATWTATSGTAVPHYHVVDQSSVQVVNRTPLPPPLPTPPPSVTRRSVTAANQAPWRARTEPPVPGSPVELGRGSFPATTSKAMWFPWPNRPFTSAAELALVPWVTAPNITSGSSAAGMLANYTAPSANSNSLMQLHSGTTDHLILLDAVHVPTRFAGIHRTITSDTDALVQAGIFPQTMPVNQLSSYREPGRVNLNTVTSDDVWNAVVAGPLATTAGGPGQPARAAPLKPLSVSGTANFASAATCLGELLNLQGTGTAQIALRSAAQQPQTAGTATAPASRTLAAAFAADTHQPLVLSGSHNPAHLLFTANRLANTATIRSNVFAVWITLRESIENDPDSIKYHRAFYIVDRTIPVAHEPGKDHNVWDAVLLRRIIE
jgi:hypothetical protein